MSFHLNLKTKGNVAVILTPTTLHLTGDITFTGSYALCPHDPRHPNMYHAVELHKTTKAVLNMTRFNLVSTYTTEFCLHLNRTYSLCFHLKVKRSIYLDSFFFELLSFGFLKAFTKNDLFLPHGLQESPIVLILLCMS